ncbi:hypothetical protein [Paenibacillus sp. Z3-2]
MYKKIMQMERLEFTSYLSNRDGNALDPVQTGVPSDFPRIIEFVIEFIAKGERTEFNIMEYGWTAGEMLKNAIIGMNQSLDKLAENLNEF